MIRPNVETKTLSVKDCGLFVDGRIVLDLVYIDRVGEGGRRDTPIPTLGANSVVHVEMGWACRRPTLVTLEVGQKWRFHEPNDWADAIPGSFEVNLDRIGKDNATFTVQLHEAP